MIEAGAKVISTGRSDFPNQINSVPAFPGIFRGAFDVRASNINEEMKMAAAQALAIVTVSKQLGHASVNTTESFYSHIIEENKAKASECIADVLLRKKA